MSKGYLLAAAAALISGVSIFLNKYAVTAIVQPLVFTAVKNSLVALLILALIFASGKWRGVKQLSRRQLLLLLAIGIIGGSLPFYLFFTGLSLIPAVTGAIIQKTLVVWVALLAFPWLKEKLSPAHWALVVLLFAANIAVGGFPGFKLSIGELFVLLATLLWAVETILAKLVLPRVDPDLVTAARMVLGSAILLTVSAVAQPAALLHVSALTLTQWSWIILTAVTLLLYVTTWYRALKFAPATAVTAILVASTLVTNVLSAVFVTHSLSRPLAVQSLAIAAVVVAFSLLPLARPRSTVSG